MTTIESITLDVADVQAARAFYEATGLRSQVRLRESAVASDGFRGFHLSAVLSQPADVNALMHAARDAGATTLKPAKKSMWGYGGAFRAPDGTIWKAVSESKKDKGPATGEISELVLLLGVRDVRTSKEFYVDQGFSVGKSFGSKYVEFETPSGPVKLALLKRAAVAKDAGVPAEGTGSHRIAIGTDAPSFTDPDGFVWEKME